MNTHLGICLILLAGLVAGCKSPAPDPSTHVSVIPRVVEEERRGGQFIFDKDVVCCVQNEEQAKAARCLSDLFTIPGGFCLRTAEKVRFGKSVVFEADTVCPPEGYHLEVTPRKITIRASDENGYFYAVQTLRQLLPVDIEERSLQPFTEWSVPAVTIDDAPRFPYRGVMLDVARYYLFKRIVLELIDCMAWLKLNRLHLHLTDDNGWRLEIKKYPLLTKIGAWRVARSGDFPSRRNALPGEESRIGGYYTQNDIREIVAYAAARHIEVIPEIDIPAHSNAALAAYPHLACPVVKDPINVLPGGGGDAAKIVYCAGNDSTFTFLQNIIDEVAELFPSRYIHLGGDEASKFYWKQCPLCRQRMQDEHITDPEDLQGYFMNRVADYVRSKGKTVMGWDELTGSRIPPGAVIFGWRGMGDAGYRAGTKGHPFVMTPARRLYLIRYQGPQWFEPRTYFGNNTLKDVYTYEPVRPEWDAKAAANLMGVQGSLWTEFVNSPTDVQYLLFPRLFALAEIAWSPAEAKDWSGFLTRLDGLLPRLTSRGIVYARSMYNLDHLVLPGADGRLRVALSCIRPDMEIRYTTDGTDPKPSSSFYNDTLFVGQAQTVKAATFAGGKRMGEILTLTLTRNLATSMPVLCAGKPEAYRLTNSLRGSDKHSDFEWCGWQGEDAVFTVDLGRVQDIDRIVLGTITNYGMAVHKPRSIRLAVSDDNRTFRPAGVITHTDEEIFREGIRTEDVAFEDLKARGRYVKVVMTNPGKCPPDHVRPGAPVSVYTDEIQVF